MRRRRRGRHYKLGRKAPAISTEWGEVRSYVDPERATAAVRPDREPAKQQDGDRAAEATAE